MKFNWLKLFLYVLAILMMSSPIIGISYLIILDAGWLMMLQVWGFIVVAGGIPVGGLSLIDYLRSH